MIDPEVLVAIHWESSVFRLNDGPIVNLVGLVGSIRSDSRVSLAPPTEATLIWSPALAQAWACDCAERVLPLFEREFPHEAAVRNAILVARSAASQTERRRAEDACEAVWRRYYDWTRERDAQSGAIKAARAALATLSDDPAEGTPSFAAFAVERETGSVEASLAEYLWQGRRLLAYLSGDGPLSAGSRVSASRYR